MFATWLKEIARRFGTVAGEAGEGVPEEQSRAEREAEPDAECHVFELSDEGEDQFGGMPAEGAAPKCSSCDEPMRLLLVLQAHPERLPLKRHAGLAVYCCTDSKDRGCESFIPASGSNAVVLLQAADLPLHLSVARSDEGNALARRRLRYHRRLERRSEEDETLEQGGKVGGLPAWIQFEDTPVCSRCDEPMRFIAQLPEELDQRLAFGDSGTGYVFACAEEHEGAFLWQCY
jgi:hypothetical protein